jgi:hypothetical protein
MKSRAIAGSVGLALGQGDIGGPWQLIEIQTLRRIVCPLARTGAQAGAGDDQCHACGEEIHSSSTVVSIRKTNMAIVDLGVCLGPRKSFAAVKATKPYPVTLNALPAGSLKLGDTVTTASSTPWFRVIVGIEAGRVICIRCLARS